MHIKNFFRIACKHPCARPQGAPQYYKQPSHLLLLTGKKKKKKKKRTTGRTQKRGNLTIPCLKCHQPRRPRSSKQLSSSSIAKSSNNIKKKPSTLDSLSTHVAQLVYKTVRKRARKHTASKALKATGGRDIQRTIGTPCPKYRLSSPHMYTRKAQTHTRTDTQNRPPVVQSTSSRSPLFTISQTLSKMKKHFCSFCFVSVLKSGEPAPLTCPAEACPLWTHLSKLCLRPLLETLLTRCFESSLPALSKVRRRRERATKKKKKS